MSFLESIQLCHIESGITNGETLLLAPWFLVPLCYISYLIKGEMQTEFFVPIPDMCRPGLF